MTITREMFAEAVKTSVEVEFEKGYVRKRNYVPQVPTARQKLFLDLDNQKEVFYGGAAGGGKSSALLMAALKYVDVPNYSALLLRRTYADLSKQGALMDRAKEWLTGSGAVWNEQRKMWTFPSGARLAFGYLETENDKFQYQGAEYQFIGFDELSQFTETQYIYLFSRLRRLTGSNVPIRMRSGSNPGGVGANWVKERFILDEFLPEDAIEEKVWTKEAVDEETGRKVTRYFVPARLDDNPYLDQAEYDESLSELDPVTRAQLRRGDWQITVRGDILYMWSEPHVIITWPQFAKVFGSTYIPLHWKLGVFQDWGTTEGHPCVTKWFATAAENSQLPGAVFCYRSMLETQVTASEMKQKIYKVMQPHNEIPRTEHWQMSHEASSERMEYIRSQDSTPYSLPFSNWKTGRTRGIEQLKRAISLKDVDKLHPFKKDIFGRPSLYFIVNDAEYQNPKTEAGMLRVRQEAPMYKWAVPKSGEVAPTLVPYALFNDACLVADTLIETHVGSVPIQDITKDHLILTRQGYQRTEGSCLTNVCAEVKTYCFSDGTTLTATPNHPLFFNGNFTAIDVIRDTISVWKYQNHEFTQKLSRSTKSIFSDTHYPNGGQSHITLIQSITMLKTGLKHYILRFGNFLTEQSHKGFIFIIKILTLLTMSRTTWSVLALPNIGIDIKGDLQAIGCGPIWQRFVPLQVNGIKVKKGETGTLRKHWRDRNQRCLNISAWFAERRIKIKNQVLSIVPRCVKDAGGINKKAVSKQSESVNFAVKNFLRGNMESQNVVQIRVVSVTPMSRQAVYNLTVDSCPEYFANGLLVHNCDVVRSAAASYFPAIEPLTDTETVEAAMPKAYTIAEMMKKSPHKKGLTDGQQIARSLMLSEVKERLNIKEELPDWLEDRNEYADDFEPY